MQTAIATQINYFEKQIQLIKGLRNTHEVYYPLTAEYTTQPAAVRNAIWFSKQGFAVQLSPEFKDPIKGYRGSYRCTFSRQGSNAFGYRLRALSRQMARDERINTPPSIEQRLIAAVTHELMPTAPSSAQREMKPAIEPQKAIEIREILDTIPDYRSLILNKVYELQPLLDQLQSLQAADLNQLDCQTLKKNFAEILAEKESKSDQTWHDRMQTVQQIIAKVNLIGARLLPETPTQENGSYFRLDAGSFSQLSQSIVSNIARLTAMGPEDKESKSAKTRPRIDLPAIKLPLQTLTAALRANGLDPDAFEESDMAMVVKTLLHEEGINDLTWNELEDPFQRYDHQKELRASRSKQQTHDFSIMTQFFISMANLYCRRHDLSQCDFGDCIETNTLLKQNLLDSIKQGLENGHDIVKVIIGSLNTYADGIGLTTEIDAGATEEIRYYFHKFYDALRAAPHTDEFFLFDAKPSDHIPLLFKSYQVLLPVAAICNHLSAPPSELTSNIATEKETILMQKLMARKRIVLPLSDDLNAYIDNYIKRLENNEPPSPSLKDFLNYQIIDNQAGSAETIFLRQKLSKPRYKALIHNVCTDLKGPKSWLTKALQHPAAIHLLQPLNDIDWITSQVQQGHFEELDGLIYRHIEKPPHPNPILLQHTKLLDIFVKRAAESGSLSKILSLLDKQDTLLLRKLTEALTRTIPITTPPAPVAASTKATILPERKPHALIQQVQEKLVQSLNRCLEEKDFTRMRHLLFSDSEISTDNFDAGAPLTSLYTLLGQPLTEEKSTPKQNPNLLAVIDTTINACKATPLNPEAIKLLTQLAYQEFSTNKPLPTTSWLHTHRDSLTSVVTNIAKDPDTPHWKLPLLFIQQQNNLDILKDASHRILPTLLQPCYIIANGLQNSQPDRANRYGHLYNTMLDKLIAEPEKHKHAIGRAIGDISYAPTPAQQFAQQQLNAQQQLALKDPNKLSSVINTYVSIADNSTVAATESPESAQHLRLAKVFSRLQRGNPDIKSDMFPMRHLLQTLIQTSPTWATGAVNPAILSTEAKPQALMTAGVKQLLEAYAWCRKHKNKAIRRQATAIAHSLRHYFYDADPKSQKHILDVMQAHPAFKPKRFGIKQLDIDLAYFKFYSNTKDKNFDFRNTRRYLIHLTNGWRHNCFKPLQRELIKNAFMSVLATQDNRHIRATFHAIFSIRRSCLSQPFSDTILLNIWHQCVNEFWTLDFAQRLSQHFVPESLKFNKQAFTKSLAQHSAITSRGSEQLAQLLQDNQHRFWRNIRQFKQNLQAQHPSYFSDTLTDSDFEARMLTLIKSITDQKYHVEIEKILHDKSTLIPTPGAVSRRIQAYQIINTHLALCYQSLKTTPNAPTIQLNLGTRMRNWHWHHHLRGAYSDWLPNARVPNIPALNKLNKAYYGKILSQATSRHAKYAKEGKEGDTFKVPDNLFAHKHIALLLSPLQDIEWLSKNPSVAEAFTQLAAEDARIRDTLLKHTQLLTYHLNVATRKEDYQAIFNVFAQDANLLRQTLTKIATPYPEEKKIATASFTPLHLQGLQDLITTQLQEKKYEAILRMLCGDNYLSANTLHSSTETEPNIAALTPDFINKHLVPHLLDIDPNSPHAKTANILLAQFVKHELSHVPLPNDSWLRTRSQSASREAPQLTSPLIQLMLCLDPRHRDLLPLQGDDYLPVLQLCIDLQRQHAGLRTTKRFRHKLAGIQVRLVEHLYSKQPEILRELFGQTLNKGSEHYLASIKSTLIESANMDINLSLQVENQAEAEPSKLDAKPIENEVTQQIKQFVNMMAATFSSDTDPHPNNIIGLLFHSLATPKSPYINQAIEKNPDLITGLIDHLPHWRPPDTPDQMPASSKPELKQSLKMLLDAYQWCHKHQHRDQAHAIARAIRCYFNHADTYQQRTILDCIHKHSVYKPKHFKLDRFLVDYAYYHTSLPNNTTPQQTSYDPQRSQRALVQLTNSWRHNMGEYSEDQANRLELAFLDLLQTHDRTHIATTLKQVFSSARYWSQVDTQHEFEARYQAAKVIFDSQQEQNIKIEQHVPKPLHIANLQQAAEHKGQSEDATVKELHQKLQQHQSLF